MNEYTYVGAPLTFLNVYFSFFFSFLFHQKPLVSSKTTNHSKKKDQAVSFRLLIYHKVWHASRAIRGSTFFNGLCLACEHEILSLQSVGRVRILVQSPAVRERKWTLLIDETDLNPQNREHSVFIQPALHVGKSSERPNSFFRGGAYLPFEFERRHRHPFLFFKSRILSSRQWWK